MSDGPLDAIDAAPALRVMRWRDRAKGRASAASDAADALYTQAAALAVDGLRQGDIAADGNIHQSGKDAVWQLAYQIHTAAYLLAQEATGLRRRADDLLHRIAALPATLSEQDAHDLITHLARQDARWTIPETGHADF